MFNPLLNDDPSSLSDQQLEDKIVKINKQLSHAYVTQSSAAIAQFKNLLMIYVSEQSERMEVQMFKEIYETDSVVTLTVDDPVEEEKVESKPKVEEREGGKLSLFRKIMSEQQDKK
ncbi:MAG: hypothetical protein M0R77_14885 [Gammaproteobacteria bacterium]|nr:hypothetical protein [Gammaproteobacteria bacterium]